MTTTQHIAINTARLHLRPAQCHDIELLDTLNHDEGVMQYLAQRPPSICEVRTMVERAMAESVRRPPFGLYIATEAANGVFVGWFQLGKYNDEQRDALNIDGKKSEDVAGGSFDEHDTAGKLDENTAEMTAGRPLNRLELEVGYRLRTHAWGRGLATEGCRALIDHAFAEPDVCSVVAVSMFTNHRSRRVMVKAGMSYITTFHVEFDDPLPGTELGEVFYAIARRDWELSQPQLIAVPKMALHY